MKWIYSLKLTAEERNLNRAEKDRLKKIQERSQNIVVNGRGFGRVDQYYLDDAGFWRNKNIQKSDGSDAKIRDMKLDELGVDIDVFEAELRRLQISGGNTPSSASDIIDLYR